MQPGPSGSQRGVRTGPEQQLTSGEQLWHLVTCRQTARQQAVIDEVTAPMQGKVYARPSSDRGHEVAGVLDRLARPDLFQRREW
jgi:hypothetical protein